MGVSPGDSRMSIRAITTEYNGYLFRSRLEARWAVFYDTLGVPYRYEPEGYEMDGLRYLPDFWMPHLDCWVEIKGQDPTDPEGEKARRLADGTGKKVFVFYGDIEVPGDGLSESAWCYFPDVDGHGGGWDNQHYWCECPCCGAFGIEYNGRSDRLACKRNGCPVSPHGDKGYNYESVKLQRAYRAARQARFEFLPKNLRRVVEDAQARRSAA